MFKFNFDQVKDNAEDSETSCAASKNSSYQWAQSEEIIFNADDKIMEEILENAQEKTLVLDEVELKYFSPFDLLLILKKNYSSPEKLPIIVNVDESNSDLLTAVYEGGFKIWECTYDLLDYINKSNLPLEKNNVLDLGCGAGLIGLLCIKKGAICTFQDYNIDVIRHITMPTIKQNDEEYLSNSRFFSGDWESFHDLLSKNDDKRYDYIFTAETIYNIENYDKLHKTFERLLTRNGAIYLAAKSYYFGLGGGVSLFEEYIKKRNVFRSESCWKSTTGLKREILKITFI